MWIYTKNAFISAVEFDPTNGYDSDGLIPPQERTHLMVRARRAEHLTSFGFSEDKIVKSEIADYPFRVFISKVQFGEMVQQAAESIDYENFKDKACEEMPYQMLSEIWMSSRFWMDERNLHEPEF